MSKGLDIGTCFLVGASYTDTTAMASVGIRSVRDCFIDFENESTTRNLLKMSKMPYIIKDDTLFVVGDSALRMANIFKKEVRRPLSKGVISPGEKDAEQILYALLDEVVGKAKSEGEKIYYSIPAAPIDINGANVAYHEAIFKKILTQMGYRAVAMNEASAIVYSNCSDEQFTAISSSCGAGMSNVALVYQTVVGMAFSVARGGDYIDSNAAMALDTTASRIMAIKEKGVNLMDVNDGDPKDLREREAIIVYYKNLIRYVIDNVREEFLKTNGSIQIEESIPWVIGGGTSMAKGFIELFRNEFEARKRNFPISISEIRAANDPLNDVAKGLLIAASFDED
jgi:hypothetical protein